MMRMVAADEPWASRLILIAKTRVVIGALDITAVVKAMVVNVAEKSVQDFGRHD